MAASFVELRNRFCTTPGAHVGTPRDMAVVMSNTIRVGASKWREMKNNSYAYNIIKSQATPLEMAIIDDVVAQIELDQPAPVAVKLESQCEPESLPRLDGICTAKVERDVKAEDLERVEQSELAKLQEIGKIQKAAADGVKLDFPEFVNNLTAGIVLDDSESDVDLETVEQQLVSWIRKTNVPEHDLMTTPPPKLVSSVLTPRKVSPMKREAPPPMRETQSTAETDEDLLRVARDAPPLTATSKGISKAVKAVKKENAEKKKEAATSKKAAKAKKAKAAAKAKDFKAGDVAVKFLVTKKNVNSRAYHKKFSEAVKAGKSSEEARALAREAGRFAVVAAGLA